MSTLTREKPHPTNGSASTDFVSLDGLLTVDDWIALPDTKPRYELIDGKLVQKMTTTNKHNWIAEELLIACKLWGRTSGWKFFGEGPGVKINRRTGYIPDLMGYTPDTRLDPDASTNPPPFIVAEVLSRSTSGKDRTDKLRDYAGIGVRMYLIVDPNAHEIEIYRLQNQTYGAPETLREDDVWQPDELPGLRVELARLWMK